MKPSAGLWASGTTGTFVCHRIAQHSGRLTFNEKVVSVVSVVVGVKTVMDEPQGKKNWNGMNPCKRPLLKDSHFMELKITATITYSDLNKKVEKGAFQFKLRVWRLFLEEIKTHTRHGACWFETFIHIYTRRRR